uniref:Uncharacterized protein n=1 Tax=Rhizophora mucronata TaxID=61149 RepID=A0A2P2IZS7_RHIMU
MEYLDDNSGRKNIFGIPCRSRSGCKWLCSA